MKFEVIERDDKKIRREYKKKIEGQRYLIEKKKIKDYEDIERRMREGEIRIEIEIKKNLEDNVMRGEEG